MSYPYCQSLPDTPLDIVGDVHGEFAAFQSLLHRLGYRDDGFHPHGRRLVFVGDLCDRGPDSPAMLAWFKQAYEHGWAWMVLGNHELNILADDPKDGSGWFFDVRAEKDAHYAPWHCVEEKEKTELRAWLAEQPLLLEREDLRIVHAAWLPPQITRLEEAKGESLTAQYRRFDAELKHRLQTPLGIPTTSTNKRITSRRRKIPTMRRRPCLPRRDTNSNAAACIRYAPSPAAWSVWQTSRFTPADAGAVRPVARGGTTTATIRPSLSAIIGAVGSRLPPPLPPNGCCCRHSRMCGTGRGATCSASISRLVQAGGQGNSRRNTVLNSSGWRRCAGRRRCWCLRTANARRRVRCGYGQIKGRLKKRFEVFQTA